MPKKLPTAFSMLFILIILISAVSWIVPVGKYDHAFNKELNLNTPLVGSFYPIEKNPQTIVDIFKAPVKGFYDESTGKAKAVGLVLFVLFIGGFLGVITKTAAIDFGIAFILKKLKAGREILLIPILMSMFAIGGSLYGLAEETLAFYLILTPIIIKAGFDTITSLSIIFIGSSIGNIGSIANPFSTIIGSNAAGISFINGLGTRLLVLGLCLIVGIIYVMRYAKIVKADIRKSLVFDTYKEDAEHFLQSHTEATGAMSVRQVLVLINFILTFIVLLIGVAFYHWWMDMMSAFILFQSLITAWIYQLSEKEFIESFMSGAKDLLSVAFIIGLAQGVVVMMEETSLNYALLHAMELIIHNLDKVSFILMIFVFLGLFTFIIPSSSGLAVLVIPILAPLATFALVPRELVVSTFQFSQSILNMMNPTNIVLMGGLMLSRVPLNKWMKFILPLLCIFSAIVLSVLLVDLYI